MTGRKGIAWHRFRDIEVAREWSGFSAQPSYAHAEEVATALLDAFEKDAADGGVDEIYLVSTEFVSMLTQRPSVVRLLPMQIEEREGERPASCRPTSSSRRPTSSSTRCFRSTSPAASTMRCSKRRLPSSRRGAGR